MRTSGRDNLIPGMGLHPETAHVAGLNTAGKLSRAIDPYLPVIAVDTVVEDAVIELTQLLQNSCSKSK